MSPIIYDARPTALLLAGLLANPCIEATRRYVLERGNHVTLMKNATTACRGAQKP